MSDEYFDIVRPLVKSSGSLAEVASKLDRHLLVRFFYGDTYASNVFGFFSGTNGYQVETIVREIEGRARSLAIDECVKVVEALIGQSDIGGPAAYGFDRGLREAKRRLEALKDAKTQGGE